MATTLCTLFNHFYLDKALVLYDSLVNVSKDFRLYILCMDDRCYEILHDLSYKEIIPIQLSNFEDDILLEAKANRSFGEYCWTCSSAFTLYILEIYNEPICTYIDADMFFYRNPELLIDEMRRAGKTVMITPHRFSPVNADLERNGLYCVEFNTFVNEEKSIKVLKEWKNNCLRCCTSVNDGEHFGDQKYLDVWPEKYPDIVHVCQHPGAGVAPWNIEWYQSVDFNKKLVLFKRDKEEIPIIFYHFQHIIYETRDVVRISVLKDLPDTDYDFVNKIYTEYLLKIEQKKVELEKRYHINYLIKGSLLRNYSSSWKTFAKRFRIINFLNKKIFASRFKNEVVLKLNILDVK